MSGKDLVVREQNPVLALFEQFRPERYNLLATVTHMTSLPAGTRLSVTEVRINPDPAAKEVFPIAGGALMPGKVALDKIAMAAGISWTEERRQDNGAHPHYCEMLVRGYITDFDGTRRELTGVKATDLREDAGGGQMGKDYAEVITKAGKANRDPSQQLMEARKFIQEITASKAKNRAIASALGIKRAYTRDELQRPFIVPKLSVDTQQKEVAQMVVAQMIGATAALYGQQPQGRVVDAEIEEPKALPAPVEEDLDPPSIDEPEAPAIPAPPVKPTKEELDKRIAIAWGAAKKAGMDGKAWKAFIKEQTHKVTYSDLTFEDLIILDAGIASYARAKNGGVQ